MEIQQLDGNAVCSRRESGKIYCKFSSANGIEKKVFFGALFGSMVWYSNLYA